MQATVHRFDHATGTGSVITDGGLVVPFGADAFGASRLRHLRTGQRLTVVLDVDVDVDGVEPRVIALSLGTVGLPPARPSRP